MIILLASASRAAAADGLKCNGHKSLCDKRFNEVAYPTTHNSMSNLDEHWQLPNQRHGIAKQLSDGIRGLMLDTHYDGGAAYLCHSICLYGKDPLARGLGVIKKFLDENPGEIITIIFESYVSAQDTKQAFEESRLINYALEINKGAQWPTLREMINSGKRLVVFTGNGGGTYPWYLDITDFTWATTWDVRRKREFTCKPDYGSTEMPLFVMNHMLTWPFVSPAIAKSANSNPFLLQRAEKCRAETGRLPNFIVVDYYSIGDIFSAVDALNGVSAGSPPGVTQEQ